MVDIPTTEPTIFTAGDTVKWTRELPDYTSGDGWVLTYAFRNAAGKLDATASGSGSTHSTTLAASATKALPPGVYQWAAYVTKAAASERYEIARGSVVVLQNMAEAAAFDARTTARRAVDDLRAALATMRSSGGRVRRYRIADREMEFETVADLLKLLRYWEGQVSSEDAAARIAAGLGSRTRVQVRF